ncbi:hypothetical protein TH15_00635 [Thalassospira profundimaris]|nr:hypothetical protein TH15_00635 [Thalassospira profundimaris]
MATAHRSAFSTLICGIEAMPISPENRALYPINWPQIREKILTRAKNHCEWCGVRNHAWGFRTDKGRFISVGKRPLRKSGHKDTPFYLARNGTSHRIVKIVLTIAHVHNPDPADCRDENLAALCQRCHNRHDAPMRRENAKRTRRAKMAIGDLFDAKGGAYVQ